MTLRCAMAVVAGWAAALALPCSQSHAWGWHGHVLIAKVAQTQLNDKAAGRVRALLNGESLADVANWMDRVRYAPEGEGMARWHYIDLPVCKPPTLECPGGDCASSRIRESLGVLTQAPADPRSAKALKIVVHLVGDIHQPLHAAENNRDGGGNGVTVMNRYCRNRYGDAKGIGAGSGRLCNLHEYWDESLVSAATKGRKTADVVAELAKRASLVPALDSNDPQRWALESNAVAREVAYAYAGYACGQSASMHATAAYDSRAQKAAIDQIAKAGLRLGRVLNMALGQ